ncbi:MAG: hypothetical protein DRI65_17435 [Chloroflexota bacterium]|nr:MAG: hypothetical protein DRI65_17435 [Chloroflexota bacterium]
MLLQLREAELFGKALTDPKSSEVLVSVVIYLAMILAIALFTLVVILIVKSIRRLDRVADKMVEVEKSVLLFNQQYEVMIQRIKQGEREREQMDLRFKNGGTAIEALRNLIKGIEISVNTMQKDQSVRDLNVVTRPEYDSLIKSNKEDHDAIHVRMKHSDKRQEEILNTMTKMEEGLTGKMSIIQQLLEAKTEIKNTRHAG